MAEQDDAAKSIDRTLALLWRHKLGDPQGTRGPRQRLSVDEVVAAGIALADEEGLEPFSMRKVAERIGIGVMTLYTYVPGRDELIGLMTDRVAGELEHPPLTGDLRNRLDMMARFLWDEYRRHPWLLQVEGARPWLGPNVSARYEWQLEGVEGIGLSDIDMDQTVALIAGFVSSAARALVEVERIQQRSGMTDVEWWEINAPILDQIMEGESYPISARVGQASGEAYQAASDPELAFEFGLARVIDGIELYVSRRSGG